MLAAAYRHCANAVSLPWNRERQKTLTVPGKLHRFLGTVVVVCEDILALFIRKEYEMLLTTNASGAITTVAESFFPFAAGSSFVITSTKDNHTSMRSIRQYAENKGASTAYVDMTDDL